MAPAIDHRSTHKLKVTDNRSYRDALLPPSPHKQPIIADTGATSHYIAKSHAPICQHVQETDDGPAVKAANGQIMTSTHQAILPLPAAITTTAKTGHILNNLQTGSLLSIGKLCDDDCIATFTKNKVYITKDKAVQLTGHRNHNNGLWNIPLAPTSNRETHTEMANGVISDHNTKLELAAFNHGTLFSPRPSTLLRAIKLNYLVTFPGLTESLIRKHLPKSLATSQGHLKAQQKNIQSTKTVLDEPIPLSTSLDIAPAQEPSNPKTHNVFLTLVDNKVFARSYSDQTGQFPVQSGRGNNYMFVLYDYDSNAILVKAIPNRRAATIRDAWIDKLQILQRNGLKPELHIIDNECSDDLKAAFRKHNVQFQRVPPHQHRRNAAERAIQTWKNHFITGLSTCDPSFPSKEWDRLIEQGEITLNLLRSSRRQPSLSAYHGLFGAFDFNKTPLAIPGTKVLVHEMPKQRNTWAQHGIPGFYIGPSMEHYRCFKCYIPSTNATRDSPTIEWFPTTIKFPTVTTDVYLKQTADDMLALLQPAKDQSPIPDLTYGSKITNAYIQIAQILRRATTRPPPRPAIAPRPEPSQVREAPPVPIQPEPRVARPTTNPPAQEPRVVIQTESPPHPTPVQPAQPPPQISPMPPATTQKQQNIVRKLLSSARPKSKAITSTHRLRPTPFRQPLSLQRHRYFTRHSQQLAQAVIPQADPYAHHIANLQHQPIEKGRAGSLRSLLKGPHKETWIRSLANEFGRLLPHGVGKNRPVSERIQGTGTIFPIRKKDVPQGRKVTYANFVCDIRPQKKESHRTRLTAGGDKLDYPHDASSPAVSVLDAKIHINSTISDAHRGARYLVLDIKNFYLGTPMTYYQYMRIPRALIPDEIINEYDLNTFIEEDNHLYCEIRKGMYGLKEAGIIAFKNLVKNLKPHGYRPMKYTPGLWRHDTKPTTFTLCVDDFGVKYFKLADAQHLINAVKANYECTIDWSGSLYVGINLRWNYEKGYVDASMNGFVQRALKKYNHSQPKKPQHSPHDWTQPIYGQRKAQQATETAPSPLLGPDGIKRIQGIAGTFNYYSEIDPCIKPALNEIATEQSAPTEITNKRCHRLMDYLATYPNATIRYHASDMILVFETDAAYLVLPKARSRASGWYILTKDPTKNNNIIKSNGPLHVMCTAIKNVQQSASEAETGSTYLGFQRAVPIRTTLKELGHPQPPQGTPAFTDNNTSHGILTSTMRPKLSKAFDMRYHWIKDRIQQKQFQLIWRKGKINMADYFSKHHPPWHHKIMRYKYIHKALCTTLLKHNWRLTSSAREGVLLPPVVAYRSDVIRHGTTLAQTNIAVTQ